MSVERPANTEGSVPRWGSDRVASALRQLGYRYVALNPGASTRGLHDSLVNHLGNDAPEILLVMHEEHAVSIAHGYAKVTREPMAVALHANVGLLHGTMAIFNAYCDRVPMLVLGANGPVDATRRRPWIDWIHTTADNAGVLRGFIKWDDQPGSVPAALESLQRATRLTRTAPSAPVYISLDVDLQEQQLTADTALAELQAPAQPAPPAPASDTVADMWRILSAARAPVLLVGRVSRDRTDWDARVALAETLNARVVTDLRLAAAFPTRHPLHAGAPGFHLSPEAGEALAEADAILSLDWMDLSGVVQRVDKVASPQTTIVHVSVDEFLHNGWSKDHQGFVPVDVPVLASPDVTVRALLDHAGRPVTSNGTRHRPPPQPSAETTGPQMGLRDLAGGLRTVIGDRPFCLARLPLGWFGDEMPFCGPLDYLGYDGGGGIGSGPGMTIGAALALRESNRLVVGVLGDGDFMMGCTAVWTAAKYRIPTLIIVANNRAYFNDELHQEHVAVVRRRPRENRWIGQHLVEPDVDIAAIARAQGAVGIGPVERRDEFEKAVRQGMEAVDNGAIAVVDARIRREYESNMALNIVGSARPYDE